MMKLQRDIVIEKIAEMPEEQVAKVLIFMAGMEAEHIIKEKKTSIPNMDNVKN